MIISSIDSLIPEIQRAQLKALCSIANSLERLLEVLETSDLFIEYKRRKDLIEQEFNRVAGRPFD
jgi:hypothetical protein